MDYPFISLGPAIQFITLCLLLVLLVVGIGIAVLLAALPGRIAAARHHPQADAVSVCGWLGLPTGILWIAAMVWAFWRQSGGSALAAGNVQDLSSQIDQIESAVNQLELQKRKEGRS